MAVDVSMVRMNYVNGLQDAAALIIQLNAVLDNLSLLYNGAGLSGTFVAQELEGAARTKHLAPADIGTYTANLDTINTALSAAILQNMAKATGTPVG